MRILILNQYFPPDAAPTGVLLYEVGESLAAEGYLVEYVSAREAYRAGQRKGGRMMREFLALFHMLIAGVRRPRVDMVISASSPPCLLIVATLIAGWHRAKSIHWSMDLYPEIAVALGELPEGILSRGISALMARAYRKASRVVVLDGDMAAKLRSYGVEAEIIRPWVFASILRRLEGIGGVPDQRWTWLYSGNLGRAHEWKTLLEAQALLERRRVGVRLLFQGGGPSRPAAEALAKELNLQCCEWADYIEEAELPGSLLRASVLVATQLPVTQGLLWPSKLGLILSLPRSILWVGPREGAVAKMLRAGSNAGIFCPGEASEIADWLADRKLREDFFDGAPAQNPGMYRDESLARWSEMVRTLL